MPIAIQLVPSGISGEREELVKCMSLAFLGNFFFVKSELIFIPNLPMSSSALCRAFTFSKTIRTD